MLLILHTHNPLSSKKEIRVNRDHVLWYQEDWNGGRVQTALKMRDGVKIFVTETPDEIDQKFYQ